MKAMAGMLFKADKPYRCKLGIHNNISTNGSGIITSVLNVSSVTTTTEWSTIVALFDEGFVHSMECRYQPFNITGVGPQAATAVPTVTAVAAAQGIQNCGVIMAAYFNNVSTLTSSTALIANPNHKLAHSAKPFTYTWRNNCRFDPRGLALDPTANWGWQGWTFVGSLNQNGGFVQIRGINDPTLAVSAVLGTFELIYDVSFRARV